MFVNAAIKKIGELTLVLVPFCRVSWWQPVGAPGTVACDVTLGFVVKWCVVVVGCGHL